MANNFGLIADARSHYNTKALTYSGTMSVNMTLANTFTFTATGDATINATGGTAGEEVTFYITGDATGGRVMTFNTNFAATDTLVISASAVSTIMFGTLDGTTWYELSRSPASQQVIWR